MRPDGTSRVKLFFKDLRDGPDERNLTFRVGSGSKNEPGLFAFDLDQAEASAAGEFAYERTANGSRIDGLHWSSVTETEGPIEWSHDRQMIGVEFSTRTRLGKTVRSHLAGVCTQPVQLGRIGLGQPYTSLLL